MFLQFGHVYLQHDKHALAQYFPENVPLLLESILLLDKICNPVTSKITMSCAGLSFLASFDATIVLRINHYDVITLFERRFVSRVEYLLLNTFVPSWLSLSWIGPKENTS